MGIVGCGGTQTGDMSGYSTGSRSLDTSSVTPATSLSAATLGAKYLPLITGRAGFAAGFTVSSFSGQADRDLGKPPTNPDAEIAYNGKAVNAMLQDIAGTGANVVRLRLFPKLSGLKLDASGLVTGLDDAFQKNLMDLIDRAEANKLQLYLCIGATWTDVPSAKDPIVDSNARNAYFKKAVTPLISKLKGRAGVFAIDIDDEIESAIAGKDGNGTDKGVTWDQARSYVKSTLDFVKSVDPQRLVTCSSGLHGADNVKAGKFSKLNLDFYDIHVFDDKGLLPVAKDLRLDRPIIVGNGGQSSKKPDADVQAKADISLLQNAQKQGYAGAILSEYGKNPDSALSLLEKDGKHRPVLSQFQSFVVSLDPTSGPFGLPGK